MIQNEQAYPQGNMEAESVNNQPMIQTHNPEFMKFLLSTDEEMQQLEISWRGMVFDETTGKFENAYPAMLNNDGVAQVISYLRNCSSKLITTSNFGMVDIDNENSLMCDTELAFTAWLSTRRTVFGIGSNADVESIKSQFTLIVESAIRRALNNRTWQGLSVGTKHTEVVHGESEQGKGKFFSRLGF